MTASSEFSRRTGALRSTVLARDLAAVAVAQGPGRWSARAACRGVEDAEVMFPTAARGTAAYEAQVRAARAVCGECPVRTQCLNYALTGEDEGVWGGLDPDERRALADTRRSTAVDDCGEVA